MELLPVCLECSHGGILNDKSHCRRESCYSHLTNCIKRKAMDYYLEHTTVDNSGLAWSDPDGSTGLAMSEVKG